MGSVQKRPNGKWRARYEVGQGKQVAQHFDRKVDAQRWLATVEADRLRGTYVDPRRGKVLLQAYTEAWRLRQVHRPSTQAYYETVLRRHVYPFLGQVELGAVRTSQVQSWVRWLGTEQMVVFKAGEAAKKRPALAPSTIGVIHGVLASMFLDAIADKVLIESPCAETALPDVEPSLVVPLQTAAVQRLTAAFPEHLGAMVVLAAGTGLRLGEVLGLTKDRVDFLRRTVRIDRQLVQVHGHPIYLGPPKTKASYRTVPLPQVVADALAAHLAVFPTVPTPVAVGAPSSAAQEVELLFLSKTGAPVKRTSFGEIWRPAANAAGLAQAETFHSLRHYYASLLIAHGESVKVVQARLGHATAAETLDTYSHLWPDSEDQTRKAVDSVLGAVPDQSRKIFKATNEGQPHQPH